MLACGLPSSSFMIIVPARAVYLITSPPIVIVCDVVEMLSFDSDDGFALSLSSSFFSCANTLNEQHRTANNRNARFVKHSSSRRRGRRRYMDEAESARHDFRARESAGVADLIDDGDRQRALARPHDNRDVVRHRLAAQIVLRGRRDLDRLRGLRHF